MRHRLTALTGRTIHAWRRVLYGGVDCQLRVRQVASFWGPLSKANSTRPIDSVSEEEICYASLFGVPRYHVNRTVEQSLTSARLVHVAV